MLKFMKRRGSRRSRWLDGGNDPLAIQNLLDHPALRVAMSAQSEPDAPVSLDWTRLMAAGPIRFDRFESTEIAE